MNKDLDSLTPVTFTAQPDSDCAGKIDITEEGWEVGGALTDVIKSTDATPRAPIAGGEYWYSIVLTAKDGYVFSEDFSDGNFNIREGSGVTFTLGGEFYYGNFALSADRKTLTAWEFMDPVIAKQGTPAVIDTVNIQNVMFSYNAGDTPKATATKGDPNAANYEIEYEYWEQMETNASGEAVPVAFWYSDENKNNTLAADKKITAFEEGKSYMYSIQLKAKDGYAFADNCTMTINDAAINATNITKSQNGLFVFAVKTIKPSNTTPTPEPTPDYKIIEGANSAWSQNGDGTLTFRANGEFTKFTGVKVDGNLVPADQYTAVSGSTIVTFNAEYLRTLSAGAHTLTVLFNDGECSTNFEVTVAQNGNGGNTNTGNTENTGGNTNAGNTEITGSSTPAPTQSGSESEAVAKAPKTGDEGIDPQLFAALFLVCGSAVAAVTAVGKRKKSAADGR